MTRLGDTDATKLLSVALRLDHVDGFPYERVKTLVERFKDGNPYAFRVLVHMVLDNLDVFDCGWEMRQKVCSLIGVKTTPRLIGAAGRRFANESKRPSD